jgi:hypothetical protein
MRSEEQIKKPALLYRPGEMRGRFVRKLASQLASESAILASEFNKTQWHWWEQFNRRVLI